MRKIVSKFLFTDRIVSDLGMLNPQNRYSVTSSSVTRLLNCFYKQCSTDVMDELLKEWHEYQSLPDNQLPKYRSLEDFWASMGQLPLPGGESGVNRFGNLSNLCKLLLVFPHSTADPERLFSIISKVDTSQRSSLLPSTVCDILSVKLNVDQDCYQSKELFTPSLLRQARRATTCCLHDT